MIRYILLLGPILLSSCAPPQGRIITRTIQAPALSSNLFGISDRQRIAIYLPPSYSSGNNQAFPVVYWLPNFNTPLWRYTGGDFQGFHLDQAMDRQIRKGIARETIIVIPNTMHFMGSGFYQNSPLLGNWEDYVAKDVVNYMDRNFRTIASSHGRGITGHGIGGTGALKLALKHSDVFGSVYAMSPALFDGNGLRDLGIFDEHRIQRWRQHLNPEKNQNAAAWNRKLQHYMLQCLNHSSRERFFDGFNLAYAAAVAPDLDLPYPHLALLTEKWDEELAASQSHRYEPGFGGWRELIGAYQAQPLRLHGITIEYSKDDEYAFIRRGVDTVAELFHMMSLPCTVVINEGNHESRLGWRLENAMLPTLCHQLGHEP